MRGDGGRSHRVATSRHPRQSLGGILQMFNSLGSAQRTKTNVRFMITVCVEDIHSSLLHGNVLCIGRRTQQVGLRTPKFGLSVLGYIDANRSEQKGFFEALAEIYKIHNIW